jgi:ubiquinone/menaquinone biosynthesis C-methylase UbiE
MAGVKAEQISVADASIDSIVVTYTLCAMVDTSTALSEMWRVLKPDGQLYFREHGRAPHPAVARLQEGSALNRDIPALLRGSHFDIIEHEQRGGRQLLTGGVR